MNVKIEYWNNGNVQIEKHLKSGIHKWFYPNGVLGTNTTRIKDQIHGIGQYWYYKGGRDDIRQFKNNVEHGPKIVFEYDDEN